VKTPGGGALVSEKSASFPPGLAQPGMAVIHTSKIAPVASKLRFKGVLEATYLIRYLLQQKSNAEIRGEMARLFGPHWNRANQERRYFDLLKSYVQLHHEADFTRYLFKEDIQIKANDQRAARNTLVRYLITVQGLHGGSEVVNDLG
jgi:hypothetical protein